MRSNTGYTSPKKKQQELELQRALAAVRYRDRQAEREAELTLLVGAALASHMPLCCLSGAYDNNNFYAPNPKATYFHDSSLVYALLNGAGVL